MSNRENYSESSFYPVEYQNQGEWLRPDSQEHRTANYLHHLPQEHHEERSHSVDHTGGLWKPPMFVPTVEVEPRSTKQPGNHQHHTAQTAQPQSDFPLLYHLLLLRNFYQNSQQFYTMDNREELVDPNQPLDLSVKGNEQYLSGFLKEKNKISYDESIKDNEEIEVVAKDEKSKSESVKEFVERKIKEYKKAEENFESFVNAPNLKENDIKRKMDKIKTKYTKINKKLKKLDQLKPKLVNEKMNDDKEKHHNSLYEIEEEIGSPLENVEDVAMELNEEPNNNKPSGENYTNGQQEQHRAEDCSSMKILSQSESNQSEDKLHLKPGHVGDGTRVLLRLESVLYPGRVTNIVPPDIYGVIVDKARGNKPHVFSREDLLKRAIHDVGVKSKSELEVGSRVCVFWSSKMNFLHPAVVTSLEDREEEYVVVTTDDGDTRDLHIKQIRLLPEDFSTLDSPNDRECFSPPGFKILTSPLTSPSSESRKKSAVSVSSDRDREGVAEKRTDLSDGRWSWADEGILTSPRSKVVHHRKISDGVESLAVGDHAVFLSKFWSRLPYLGKIVDLWQTSGGRMKVKINWLYHKDEVDGLAVGGGRVEDVVVARAVFESSHFDDNNVQSISHKCRVIKSSDKTDEHYDYCTVGHFDPVEGSVKIYDDQS